MNSFDPELLAALAEGSLSPAAAAALEARIATNPAALAEPYADRESGREEGSHAPALIFFEINGIIAITARPGCPPQPGRAAYQ